ncbi:MAG TPA: PHB depolymerase family esterase [Caulobacteraceae bacterium]|jgi:pimeloyl-ACP methyl ester carboxylesterase|nr:PHB depolymerase family esterase [Caulobacteraceae bacterium]
MTPHARRLATCILLAALGAARTAAGQATGLQPNVVFSEETPLSSNAELARRLLTPLTAAQVPQLLARGGKMLAAQPLNPSDERFVVYVPRQPPPQGYGLLVFVPPWPEAALPPGWGPVLDRHGIIFVSAARSGNDASVLGRREPLALIGAANIESRYKVDPARVYVGGLSGGSRIAMRIALGYPDVFRGAFLNAGSDPIGDAEIPLPPRDLFLRFQESMRLVYVTGDADTVHLGMDAGSMGSMRDWCVFDIEDQVTPGAAHQLANADALSRALTALDQHRPPAPAKLAACRARIDGALNDKLKQLDTLVAAGKRDEALKLLTKVDQRFGGLAAPRSLQLSQALGPAK